MIGVEVTSRSTNMSEDILRRHRKRLMDAASVGFAHSQQMVPQDRGTLAQTAFPPEFRGDDVFFGYTQPYAEAMEEGTRPYYPPIEPLKAWARRKGLPEGVAYAVQQKIGQEGIDAQPYLEPAAERMQSWLGSHEF